MSHSKEPLTEQVMEALKGAGCCDFRFSVEQLGLISDVRVTGEGAASVKVLPCCIFGMTRLVASVKESLARIEGLTEVDVDVAWDLLGERASMPQAAPEILQLDLESRAKEHGLKPWGATQGG